jgi:hypothetical protein
MKVLGLSRLDNEEALIIEISNYELERLMGSFYRKKIPGSAKSVYELMSGDVVDIGNAIDLTERLQSMLNAYTKAHEEFQRSSETIMNFVQLVSDVCQTEHVIQERT